MTKKETPTTNTAIREALAEGLQTPEEIQVHLRKQGLDLGKADISYHKGRIQAEQTRPLQVRPSAVDDKVSESATPLMAAEKSKPEKVAPPKPLHQPGPQRRTPKPVRQEKAPRSQAPRQIVELPQERPIVAVAREEASAPRGKVRSERKTTAGTKLAVLNSQKGAAPTLDDLFAVKALVKRKGGSLARLVQQVTEVEELAGRMGGLANLKRCLEVLQQLAGD